MISGPTGFTFQELLSWSTGLPSWQQDALRRLLTQGELSKEDIAELGELAKAPYFGVHKGFESVPPSVSDIPADGPEAPAVSLLSISNIQAVNALARGPIRFQSNGLTVVYGENASGKTGVARILKKTCRARDAGGAILSSVFEPDPGQPASATLEYQCNDEVKIARWEDGKPSHSELSSVHVLDAACAQVQIERANHVSYTPRLVKIFRELVQACERVASFLRDEKSQLNRQSLGPISANLRSNTEAGRYLSTLSGKSDPAEIGRLAALSAPEKGRIKILQSALRDDPTTRIGEVVAQLQRLDEVSALLTGLEATLADEEWTQLVEAQRDAIARAQAAQAATKSFATGALLDGLGNDAWKVLWEAARRYSENDAYPTEPFPVTREDALCVLCNQPLAEIAADRLRSFEEYVHQDVQEQSADAVANLSVRQAHIDDLEIPFSARIVRDLALPKADDLAATFKRFMVSSKLRRRHFSAQSGGKIMGPLPPLLPRPDLRPLQESLQQERDGLRAAERDERRQAMAAELAELEDREKLGSFVAAVKSEIGRLADAAKFDNALSDCDTTGITRKAGEVAELIVTNALRSAFSEHLSAFGFSTPPVEVKRGRGEYGQHPHQISLLAKPNVPAGAVLSEGEKTCVALAGFLAELETTRNRSAIVLDDPISSLDHMYRGRVADGLVREAKHRQVVVLTHDVVFLFMLRKYGRNLGVIPNEITLERGYHKHGHPKDGPPWVALPVRRRIGVLRLKLQEAEAVLRKGDRETYELQAEWIYKKLRESWERAVEEVLLNKVVLRFGDAVETQRLPKITDITDADVQHVTQEMSRCSSHVHDEAGAASAGIPEPPAIQSDIKRLGDWVEDLRKNRGRL